MANTDRLLRRLLQPSDIEGLLADFTAMVPGTALALIEPDGRRFAGTVPQPEAEVEALLLQAGAGDTVVGPSLFLCPLWVGSQLAGALVGRGPMPAPELRFLRRVLTLLMSKAAETREMGRETLDRYRELNLLYRAAETVGSCLDPDEIPRLELAEALHVVQADVAAVCLTSTDGDGDPVLKAEAGDAGEPEALVSAAQQLISEVRHSGQAGIRVLPASARLPGAAVLCAPHKARERNIGVTLLARRGGKPVFTASDAKLVTALAGQAAIALERAWMHQQEIEQRRLLVELALGRRIQLGLLPQSLPQIPGWEFAAAYQAAQEVGGDYYDFLRLAGEPHRLGLIIADVTGKGLPAALMMANGRAILRSEAMRQRRPTAVLRRTNAWLLQDSATEVFLTAFYASLDIRTGELVYARGGHDWPLWVRHDTGECLELKARGTILGAFRNIGLEEGRITLAPGDLLVCYTDGVTDVQNPAGELFSGERMQEVVMARRNASAAEIVQAIVEAAANHAKDSPPADDFTLFVVKRAGAG